jgi:copper chaperone
MKSVLKVPKMKTLEDVNNIRKAIASNEGVVACEVSKDKGEISVVYDNYFVDIETIIESIEELGYTVL